MATSFPACPAAAIQASATCPRFWVMRGPACAAWLPRRGSSCSAAPTSCDSWLPLAPLQLAP
jgi:hypothetical protein